MSATPNPLILEALAALANLPEEDRETIRSLTTGERIVVLRKFGVVSRAIKAPRGKLEATAREIAAAENVSVSSIQKWISTFRQKGITGLIDRRVSILSALSPSGQILIKKYGSATMRPL